MWGWDSRFYTWPPLTDTQWRRGFSLLVGGDGSSGSLLIPPYLGGGCEPRYCSANTTLPGRGHEPRHCSWYNRHWCYNIDGLINAEQWCKSWLSTRPWMPSQWGGKWVTHSSERMWKSRLPTLCSPLPPQQRTWVTSIQPDKGKSLGFPPNLYWWKWEHWHFCIAGFPAHSLGYTRQTEIPGTHHHVAPQGWTVCLLLSTFQGLLMFVLYGMSRGFSCT